MRSPRRVCSRGSSHAAHCEPTNVLSLRPALGPDASIKLTMPSRGREETEQWLRGPGRGWKVGHALVGEPCLRWVRLNAVKHYGEVEL